MGIGLIAKDEVVKIEKKLALIIGGSGGIGFEAAKALYNRGFGIFLTYHAHRDAVEKNLNIEKIEILGLYEADVQDENSVSACISQIVREYKKIDVVVYCVAKPLAYQGIKELEWRNYLGHFEVQVKGMFSAVKALHPLISSNHKIKFIAVLTESCIGKPPSMLSHYVTAKYGLMGFMKAMASELGKNCTFNMVSPTMTKTNLLSGMPARLIEAVAAKNPVGRIAEPSDTANVIAFLSSEEADYLNGINIPVNGGNIFM